MKLSQCSYNPGAVHPGYNAPHDNLQMLAAEMGNGNKWSGDDQRAGTNVDSQFIERS